MRLVVDNSPKRKLIKLLAEMQGIYDPTKNWYVLYLNLVDFAESKGFMVYTFRNFEVGGRVYVLSKKIELNAQHVVDMTRALAHELGHFLAHEVGIPKQSKKQWEAVADGIGEVIIELLTNTKPREA